MVAIRCVPQPNISANPVLRGLNQCNSKIGTKMITGNTAIFATSAMDRLDTIANETIWKTTMDTRAPSGTDSRFEFSRQFCAHFRFFRCLVEGGGNVAFIKHTTVMENCDGKRKEWWARNQLTSDFELLCRDGTRTNARNYKNCYLGKVKANAIVTNPRIGQGKLNAFINLFKYAQQFYGQKVPDEFSFSMFISEPPYADLIFQV